jgi:hypothetical protein
VFSEDFEDAPPLLPGADRQSLAGVDWEVAQWGSLLWSADRERVARRLCEVASRNLSRSEWDQYLPEEDFSKTCEQWPAGR